MYRIAQDGFQVREYRTKRAFDYALKVAEGRRAAFGKEYSAEQLVGGVWQSIESCN